MIAMATVLSTVTRNAALSRRHALLAATALLAGCVARSAPPGPAVMAPEMDADAFTMADGARLPYRTWLPDGPPTVVVLALHGFNDSRDAWEIPAPDFAAAGIAVYSPDQRGFGAAPGRGLWPGGEALVDDAAAMTALLRARHPGLPLYLMGESMAGAVLMLLAARPDAPAVAGYVLLAPAVWSRSRMNPFLRSALWLAATFLPGVTVSRPPPSVRIYPSDNNDAIRRLAADPLTVKATRFDTLKGLVDLMDAAMAIAPGFDAPALFQYGAHDDLVPQDATRVVWRELPPGPRRAFYPRGWHFLMRDLHRAEPIADAIAWIRDPAGPLPSPAEARAAAWLAGSA
jgi:alpha-beta hydrolase superfamily lysophospholipase